MAISFMLVSFQIQSSTQAANQYQFHSVNDISLPTITRSSQNSSKYFSRPKQVQVVAKEEAQDSSSFSGCLIIMDDNHFLIEWLAYHWHVLPLRRLIVAVDPRSRYSPRPILDRYRDRGLMEITVWTDTDFMVYPNFTKNVAFQYLQRQLEFYAKCTAKLKQEGRSWTLFVDTDEFITPNHYAAPNLRVSNNMTKKATTSLFQKLEQIQQANVSRMMSSPCVVLPRLRFGTKESTAVQIQHLVPNIISFSGMDFMTLRWRWRARSAFGKNTNNPHNGMPKCMVNLQYVEDSMLQYDLSGNNPVDRLVNAHRPVMALCSEVNLRTMVRHASFVTHHYPGTLEQWTFRDDGRAGARTQEAYAGLAKRARKSDDSIRPWLQEFANVHGDELAHRLLDGVGNVSSNSIAFDAAAMGVEKKGR
jgi:hypothetical protein